MSSGRRSASYIPHPAPSKKMAEDKAAAMGATVSLLTTIVLPAAIALSLYLLLSYLIIPLWQRYRGRYSRYIPLETISTQTSSLRQRLQDAVARLLLPSSWRSDFSSRFTASAQDGSDGGFDEEDGEELLDVDDNRREALSLDARRSLHEGGRRLSRDLEEGFADESDDEEPANGRRVR